MLHSGIVHLINTHLHISI